MRLVSKLLVAAFFCLIIVGYFRGWYSFSKSIPDPESNKVNIDVSVDRNKMRSDIKEAKEKVQEEVKEIKDKWEANKAKEKEKEVLKPSF